MGVGGVMGGEQQAVEVAVVVGRHEQMENSCERAMRASQSCVQVAQKTACKRSLRVSVCRWDVAACVRPLSGYALCLCTTDARPLTRMHKIQHCRCQHTQCYPCQQDTQYHCQHTQWGVCHMGTTEWVV